MEGRIIEPPADEENPAEQEDKKKPAPTNTEQVVVGASAPTAQIGRGNVPSTVPPRDDVVGESDGGVRTSLSKRLSRAPGDESDSSNAAQRLRRSSRLASQLEESASTRKTKSPSQMATNEKKKNKKSKK